MLCCFDRPLSILWAYLPSVQLPRSTVLCGVIFTKQNRLIVTIAVFSRGYSVCTNENFGVTYTFIARRFNGPNVKFSTKRKPLARAVVEIESFFGSMRMSSSAAYQRLEVQEVANPRQHPTSESRRN